MDRAHWDKVYTTKAPDEVSWYRAHLDTSLSLIERTAPSRDAAIIDVGGGESTLVDDLLARGYSNVTVLDISPAAIEVTKARLGKLAERVQWLAGDITQVELPAGRYDVWHDRAVFHFLTSADQRREYVARVTRSVKAGGFVIIGAFGPDGPAKCSGLPVERYDADALHGQFGRGFRLVDHVTEDHVTPKGTRQQFVYCFCVLE